PPYPPAAEPAPPSVPARRSSARADLDTGRVPLGLDPGVLVRDAVGLVGGHGVADIGLAAVEDGLELAGDRVEVLLSGLRRGDVRSEEHTSELQSRENIVCRLLLE